MTTGDKWGGFVKANGQDGGKIQELVNTIGSLRANMGNATSKLTALETEATLLEDQANGARQGVREASREFNTAQNDLCDILNVVLANANVSVIDALSVLGCDTETAVKLNEQWCNAKDKLLLGEKLVLNDKHNDELVWGELAAIHPELAINAWTSDKFSVEAHLQLVRPAKADGEDPVKSELVVPVIRFEGSIVDKKGLENKFPDIYRCNGRSSGLVGGINIELLNKFGENFAVWQWMGNDPTELKESFKNFEKVIAQQVTIRRGYHGWSIDRLSVPNIGDGGNMRQLTKAIEVMRTCFPGGYNILRRNIATALALTVPDSSYGSYSRSYSKEVDMLNFAQADSDRLELGERYQVAQAFLAEGTAALAQLEAQTDSDQ